MNEQRRHPERGIDYPGDVTEFEQWFPDEEACLRFLERLRWPDGFECPRCGRKRDPWRSSHGHLICPDCRKKVSVTAGTIFHRTRKPLKLWFRAAWEVTSQKYGANALGLQRVLGLGSYRTAWSWLHKFRRAMVRPGRSRLSGLVEVDETYVGGSEAGTSGRETIKKAIVAVAVELNEAEDGTEGMARIRLRHIPDVSEESLVPFLQEVVEPGSTVRTDGWRGYTGLENAGFEHDVIKLSASPDPAHVLMPNVHRVASLLKRWILGTLQGGVAKEQLEHYLDEFTFRFNRRSSRARGLLFYRLLENAVRIGHTPTHALEKSTGRGRPFT
jgi:transposase-like protein